MAVIRKILKTCDIRDCHACISPKGSRKINCWKSGEARVPVPHSWQRPCSAACVRWGVFVHATRCGRWGRTAASTQPVQLRICCRSRVAKSSRHFLRRQLQQQQRRHPSAAGGAGRRQWKNAHGGG